MTKAFVRGGGGSGTSATDGLGNGLVGQRPFEMGYKSLFILKDIAEGKSVDDPIFTGLDVCDNDNIDTCVQ